MKMKVVVRVLIIITLVLTFIPMIALSAQNDRSSEYNSIEYLTEFITNFIERRTQLLIDPTHQVQRLAISIDQYSAFFSKEEAVVQESNYIFSEERRAAVSIGNVRDVLRQFDEAFTHFDVEITVLDYKIDDSITILVVRELTILYYEKIRGDEPDNTAWAVEREFVFESDLYSWELVSHRLLIDDNSLPPINEPINSTKNEMVAILNSPDVKCKYF